jgi:2-polyprenyl-3-methyl-5-hydroxy-6-metoxy-1,4-benzoquinol methylase
MDPSECILSWKKISSFRSKLPSIRHFPIVQDSKRFIAAYIASKANSVLDIGSSDGIFLHEYLRPLGFNGVYVGVDIDPVLKTLKLDFPLFDRLDKVKGEFDAILMLDVLEHLRIEEALEYLKIAKEKLSSNGLLFITTPNVYCPLIHNDITHITFIPYADLYSLLKEIGFQRIYIYRTTPLFSSKSLNVIKRQIASFVCKLVYPLLGLDYCTDILVIAY